ncbi:MAG: helix-turn-helix transcriptional regulator [Dermatophilaceae bacterium]
MTPLGVHVVIQSVALQRSRRGLSQAALANKAGLAYLTVSRIERGKSGAVQALTAYKLASALLLDVEDLTRALRQLPAGATAAQPPVAIRSTCPQAGRRTDPIR